MFKNTLTVPALAALLLMSGTAITTSCSQADKQEVAAESDQAYNDLNTFVTDVETRADAVGTEMEDEYNRETEQFRTDYDTRVAAVERYNDRFDEARRQEIEDLKNRYTAASQRRETNWNNRANSMSGDMGDNMTVGPMGQYYKPSNPAGQITAANARTTYENFVKEVQNNKERYDINDWRNVNAEWRALDEAYDDVKGNMSASDLAEIQKEKLKYAATKSWDKTKLRAGQAADAVTGQANEVSAETADERSRVGQAVSNTASDVKDAGKDVGQGAARVGKNIGQGAAEVGKDTGQGAAKAGKKVGGAVKDVFDGKDND